MEDEDARAHACMRSGLRNWAESATAKSRALPEGKHLRVSVRVCGDRLHLALQGLGRRGDPDYDGFRCAWGEGQLRWVFLHSKKTKDDWIQPDQFHFE